MFRLASLAVMSNYRWIQKNFSFRFVIPLQTDQFWKRVWGWRMVKSRSKNGSQSPRSWGFIFSFFGELPVSTLFTDWVLKPFCYFQKFRWFQFRFLDFFVTNQIKLFRYFQPFVYTFSPLWSGTSGRGNSSRNYAIQYNTYNKKIQNFAVSRTPYAVGFSWLE